jgi:TP901 family phage tail tape measure protein
MAATLYQFKADLKGLIELEAKLKSAKAELDKLKKGTAEYDAQSKKLKGIQGQFNKQADAMRNSTQAANQMNSAGRRLINTFKSAAVAIASAFAVRAIVGAVRGAIQVFADFEKRMDAVAAISGATGDEFDRLVSSAQQLGKTTVFTASEVAQLQEEFARLGFSAEEIRSVQRATLDLAAATGESLANSAQVAGSVLRAFNMEAASTQRVTDVMSQAFSNSALTLEKFKESMKFVAPVARSAGFTIEETSSMLMKLADSGLSGSLAGNALKNIFMRLGDSSSDLAKRLGGPVRSMPALVAGMRQLKEEGFGLTDAVELLDKRSAPAFLALMTSIEGLEPGVDLLNEAEGATQRMAAIRLDNLSGDMTLMRSAMEGLGIAIGEELNLGMRQTVYSLTRFIQRLSDSQGFLKGVQITAKLLTAVLAGLAVRLAGMGIASFTNMIVGAGRAMVALVTQTKAAIVAKTSLKAVMASTPWGAIAQGVTTAVTALVTFKNKTTEAEMAQVRLNDAMEASIKNILQHNSGSKERADLMRQLANDYPSLLKYIDLERATTQELNHIKKAMAVVDVEAVNNKIASLERQIALEEQRVQGQYDANVVQMDIHRAEMKRIGDQNDAAYIREMNAVYTLRNQNGRLTKRLNNMKTELRAEKSKIYEITKVNKEGSDLQLEDGQTLRKQLNQEYLIDLQNFRNASQKRQEVLLEEGKARLEFLKNVVEYNNILADGMSATGEIADSSQARADAFLSKLSTDMQSQILAANKTQIDYNIELSVFRKHINDLTGALKRSGGAIKTSGISGAVLQKTKDNFKQLAKLMDSIITDNYDRLIRRADTHLAVETEKYQKEIALMQTNKANLEKLSLSTDAELLSKTIKKNRQKYEVLKNLDIDHYNNLISEKDVFVGDMLKIIDKILQEEINKEATNNAILLELERDHARKVEQIKNEEVLRKATLEQRFMDAAIDLNMKGELKLFARMNQRQKNRKAFEKQAIDFEIAEMNRKEGLIHQHYTNLHNALVQQLMDGEITQQQFDNRRIKNDKAMTDAILNNRKEHQSNIDEINTTSNQADVALQVEKIQAIGEYYATAFNALSTFLSNQFELEMASINETRDLKNADLQDEMEQELAQAQGNAEAQEAIREQYAERQRINEQKREEELRKVRRKQFIMEKTNSIISAIINGAVAITKVAGQTGIGAIAAAPIMSALVAAQIAAIASQKFVGAKGGIIPAPDQTLADGGMVVGPSHAQGGVKFAVGGRVAELEGGEAVINKRSTAMFKPQLSAINAAGGGVRFEQGGIMPGVSNKVNEAGLGNMSVMVQALGEQVVAGVNSKQVTVTESDITSTQNNVSILELQSAIL